jgi:hypothetical protein
MGESTFDRPEFINGCLGWAVDDGSVRHHARQASIVGEFESHAASPVESAIKCDVLQCRRLLRHAGAGRLGCLLDI